MRVTGADYAGLYQEQLFHRQLSLLRPLLSPTARAALDTLGPPVLWYAPLLHDWSGAKLSKSLYVKLGADAYLARADVAAAGLLEYRRMARNAVHALFAVVREWFEEPKQLYRSYSIEYLRVRLGIAAPEGPEDEADGAVGRGWVVGLRSGSIPWFVSWGAAFVVGWAVRTLADSRR